MAEGPPDINKAMEALVRRFVYDGVAGEPSLLSYAQKMEQYAKAEAPWEDRTGDARKGLRGDVFYRPGVDMGVTLAHTVEYGQYLETANDGKYAILKPTVEHFMPEIKNTLRRVFGGKG
jgi:hypothetical protein